MPVELNTYTPGYAEEVASYRKTYAEVLARTALETDDEKRIVKMTQAGDLAATLGRSAPQDLAVVQRLARAMDTLEQDAGKADKKLEGVQAEYADHLIRRLQSAAKCAFASDLKLLQRAVTTCETVMAAIPGRADPTTHLKKFESEKVKLDQARTEAEADAEQVKNAGLAIERAKDNAIFRQASDTLHRSTQKK